LRLRLFLSFPTRRSSDLLIVLYLSCLSHVPRLVSMVSRYFLRRLMCVINYNLETRNQDVDAGIERFDFHSVDDDGHLQSTLHPLLVHPSSQSCCATSFSHF